ncbi:MAG: hypothetical protein H8E59_11475 [Actinobacteria bacterium]|nr:hypothetical protein [Actinomycetota bacterium]
MAVDERKRLAIRICFAEQLNDYLADAIIEPMPPIEWADVATRDDVALMGRELRAGTAEFRAEMHLEFAHARNEFADAKRWMVMSGIGIASSSWAAAIAIVALN